MKKKIFFAILTLIFLIFLFLFIYDKKSEQEHLFSNYSLSKSELALIKDGDIILRHGFGLVSDFIVKSQNSDIGISHCAIITKENGKFIVIHSVSQSLSDFDGVQKQSLENFIKDSQENSVIIVRYKLADSTHLDKIGARAKYYLRKKVPFDNKFDIEDSSEIYCSELIWKVFNDEYKDDIFLSPDKQKKYDITKFHAFLDSARFKIIINHHSCIKE